MNVKFVFVISNRCPIAVIRAGRTTSLSTVCVSTKDGGGTCGDTRPPASSNATIPIFATCSAVSVEKLRGSVTGSPIAVTAGASSFAAGDGNGSSSNHASQSSMTARTAVLSSRRKIPVMAAPMDAVSLEGDKASASRKRPFDSAKEKSPSWDTSSIFRAVNIAFSRDVSPAAMNSLAVVEVSSVSSVSVVSVGLSPPHAQRTVRSSRLMRERIMMGTSPTGQA